MIFYVKYPPIIYGLKNTAKYTPMLKHNSEDTFSPAVDE
jgi:hypothetical protein